MICIKQLYTRYMDPTFYNNLINAPLASFYPAMKGGATIALAATLYYYFFGGILGMSGLAGSIVKFPTRTSNNIKVKPPNTKQSSSLACSLPHQSSSSTSVASNNSNNSLSFPSTSRLLLHRLPYLTSLLQVCW